MKYTHMIFDLDGTLIDSEKAVLKTWQVTLQEHVGCSLSLTQLKVVLGITTEVALHKLGIKVNHDFEHQWIKNYQKYAGEMKYFEGMEALLKKLREKGCNLGIVTSRSRKEYELYFKSLALETYFPTILCADDTQKHKPDPEPLYTYMNLTSAAAASCMYIGDMPTDIACAKAAGMCAGYANWQAKPVESEADFTFMKPADILELWK